MVEKHKQEVEANPALVQQMITLGIPETQAIIYLKRCKNDLNDAINLYFQEFNSISTSNTSTSSNVNPLSLDLSNLTQFPSLPSSTNPSRPPHETQPLTTDLLKDVLSKVVTTTPAVGGNAGIGDLSDPELNRVIELSKYETYQGSSPMVSKEEEEINRVIEKSLQEVKGDQLAVVDIYNNPNFRKREPNDIAVGLKNIGNTCYINSMLQTYFMIPQLKYSVLQFPYDLKVEENDPNKDNINFMKELQKLFTSLSFSNQKYIDPSHLLKKTIGADGKPVFVGNQEDVADFNDLFLTLISKGFQVCKEKDQTKELLLDFNETFYGKAIQFLNANEEDGSSIETQTETDFKTIILPVVGEEPTDLYQCLDTYVENEVDYTTEKGHKTKGLNNLWFKKAPSLLMLQQSRVIYDPEKKSSIKKEIPIKFEKEIFIDRYLIENRKETRQIRQIVSNWRKELSELNQKLKTYTNFKGRSHGLDEALQSVIDYCNEKPELVDIVPRLSTYLDSETQQISELKRNIDEVENKIATAYNNMKNCHYTLFAVWVHQGVAGSGHYWAHIRNPKTNQYIKFNDMRVNQIDEETVMKEAIGGMFSNTSAYFLIYLSDEAVQKLGFRETPEDLNNLKSFIPPQLLKEVEDDNEKFSKELQEFDKTQSTDKLEQLVNKYTEKIQETEKFSKNLSMENDMRIKSFFVFLDSLGKNEEMFAEILREVYTVVFERGIEKDVGFEIYDRLKERLGKELIEFSTKIAFESAPIDFLRSQHRLFQDASFLLEHGLELMLQQSFSESLRFFVASFRLDSQITEEKGRRPEILEISLVCLLAFLETSERNFTTENLSSFRRIVAVARELLSLQDPLLQRIHSRLLTVRNSPMLPTHTLNVLNKICEDIFIPQKPSLPFGLPEAKRLELNQYGALAKHVGELYQQYSNLFATLINQVKQDKNLVREVAMKDS